jgi:hypothetical protein
MAWGCSTGRPSATVAVLDMGYHDVEDIHATWVEHYDNTALRHGTAVASVITATGDNHIGITGVMWRSDLRLWDRTQPITGVTGLPKTTVAKLERDGMLNEIVRMRKAILGGARVVNVSGGLYFPGTEAPIPDTPAGRTYLEKRVRPAMRWVLNLHDGQPTAPLFVFAAGNGDSQGIGRDASLNGFPVIEQDFPSRVLVVAATYADASHSQVRLFSNIGPLVQIAAPGDRVLALDQSGSPRSFDGTSAATALVSGVAGLLISFDSVMTVSQVRDFIVAGALQGGWRSAPRNSTDSIPYLNAYESLKLAARRLGSPLCGNRMWKDGDNVIVERDANTLEVVAQLVHQYPQLSFISAYHGGRRFDMNYGREFDWDPNSRLFREVPYQSLGFNANGGTFMSYNSESHDGTTFMKAGVTSYDSTGFTVTPQLFDAMGQVLSTAQSQYFALAPYTIRCVIRLVETSHGCVETDRDGTFTTISGDRAYGARFLMAADTRDTTAGYVVIQLDDRTIYHSGQWTPCGLNGGTPQECDVTTLDSTSSGMLQVFRINFTTGAWTTVALAPNQTSARGRTIQWLGVRETGDEIMWGIGRTDVVGGSWACTNQSMDFVSLVNRGNQPAGTLLRRVSVPDGEVCSGDYEAGATATPYRAGSIPGTLIPAPVRAPTPNGAVRWKSRSSHVSRGLR